MKKVERFYKSEQASRWVFIASILPKAHPFFFPFTLNFAIKNFSYEITLLSDTLQKDMWNNNKNLVSIILILSVSFFRI